MYGKDGVFVLFRYFNSNNLLQTIITAINIYMSSSSWNNAYTANYTQRSSYAKKKYASTAQTTLARIALIAFLKPRKGTVQVLRVVARAPRWFACAVTDLFHRGVTSRWSHVGEASVNTDASALFLSQLPHWPLTKSHFYGPKRDRKNMDIGRVWRPHITDLLLKLRVVAVWMEQG